MSEQTIKMPPTVTNGIKPRKMGYLHQPPIVPGSSVPSRLIQATERNKTRPKALGTSRPHITPLPPSEGVTSVMRLRTQLARSARRTSAMSGGRSSPQASRAHAIFVVRLAISASAFSGVVVGFGQDLEVAHPVDDGRLHALVPQVAI